MAIRLKLADGTSVESDSVEELAKFYQQLSRNGHQTPKEHATLRVSGTLESLPDTATALVKLLLPANDGLDTSDVAKSLSVGPRGIGGFVTALSNWGKRNGYTKKQLLVKGRRMSGDRSVRTMMLNKNFRQILKEGKVPGMKLDA